MGNLIDLTNCTFNRWTVLRFDKLDKRGEASWLCRCTCGTVKSVLGSTLRNMSSKGCTNCRPNNRLKGSDYTVINDIAEFCTKSSLKFWTSQQDAMQISKHSWCLSKDGYLVARINGKTHKIHHLIMGKPLDLFIDHINGNKLDNRRCNLRIANFSQNACNSNIYCNNTSGYKGVCWNKKALKWQVNIQYMGSAHFIGFFDNRENAALAYNEAAKSLHGDFACLNPIGDTKEYRTIQREEVM